MNIKPTKKQQVNLDRLSKHLNITTQSEKMVLEHIFFKDVHREILLWQYKTIKENAKGYDNFILIEITTNKNVKRFGILTESILNNNFSELNQKIN